MHVLPMCDFGLFIWRCLMQFIIRTQATSLETTSLYHELRRSSLHLHFSRAIRHRTIIV